MFDNINIYRGRARYVRLKQKLVPIQWNFTVRAALTPTLEGIENLFTKPETADNPQKPVAKMDFTDLLIGLYLVLNIPDVLDMYQSYPCIYTRSPFSYTMAKTL